MRSSKCLISIFSSVDNCLKDVVLIIPFRAATICGPCIFYWDPSSSNCINVSDRSFIKSHNSSSSIAISCLVNCCICRNANFRCFTRFSYAVAMILQKLQGYVKVLQSYSTLCTEKVRVMSSLVNCDIMQIILELISAVFCPRSL